MAEEIDRGSSDRQATWVALKTLRQRPTVVGQTEDGATVYEIRSVRLVLTPGSSHFKRLVMCAKCGRDVPGASILAPVDLDRPANTVYCDRCAQSSGLHRAEIRRERQDPPAPAPPVVIEEAVETGRRAAVEAPPAEVPSRAPFPAENAGELQRLSQQVADLLRGRNAELAKMSASLAEVRAEMRELGESNRALALVQRDLDQRIVELESHPGAEIEAAVARELADVRASLTAMIDATAQPLHAALAEGLDTMRSEIASLQQRLDDEPAARPEIGELAESNRALAQAQRDLDQRVGDLAAQLSARSADPDAAVARELAELRASVAAASGAGDTQLRVEVGESLELLRGELASVAQRSRDELAAVVPLLEAQRRDLTEALHDVAHETLMSVAEPLRDLTKAREEFERRIESLQLKAQEDQRRVEELRASVNAGALRLHALEQEEEWRVGRRVPDALLESLDRQLREAEDRLKKL